MSALLGNLLTQAVRFFGQVARIGLVLTAATASAAPTLTVECSSAQIRKGESFKIYLKITAEENMSSIDVKLIVPTENTIAVEEA